MAPDIIKFTYQVTYPTKVFVLVYFYQRNELHKLNPDSREDYMKVMADFIEHLKDISKTNDTEPRKTHILDTLEGINSLTNYLITLWKIEPNIKRNTSLLSLKMA